MPAAVPAVPVPGQPQPEGAEPYSATFRGSFGTRAECEKALRNMLDDAINRAALLTNFPACFCDSDTPGEDKHLLAQFIIQNFTGMYKAMILLVTKFREALYREVCLLHQNLPEG